MDRRDHSAVLMVAYHFPPLTGSSGIQRTLRFCRYLPEFGWQPKVLTVHPRAYEAVSDDQLADIPRSTVVRRAFSLNTARHLSIRGRYPGWLALPDRWVTWCAGAVPLGLAMIRRHRPRAIFSTYPIATAHLIGLLLHRLTGLPWIADFRDPMAQDGYPPDRRVWKAFAWIESQAFRYAARSLFTSPGAIEQYARRYPSLDASRWVLLENGYDEEAFAAVPAPGEAAAASAATHRGSEARRRLVVLHSGIVYPWERDPSQLFAALGALKRSGALAAADVEFRFRASAYDEVLAGAARRNDIEDLVTLAPPIGYRDALAEMASADALLVMQAANCNAQIPAKAYEYLRAGAPILALTDPAGDTGRLLARAGVHDIAPLDSEPLIAALVGDFLDRLRRGEAARPSASFAALCSRRERTRELALVLDAVAA